MAFDKGDVFEELPIALLLSSTKPLDIVWIAPREFPDDLSNTLGVSVIECPIVQEPLIRLLGRTSSNAFSCLSWLSLEDALNNARPEETLRGSAPPSS